MDQIRTVNGRLEIWLQFPLPGGWVCAEPDDTTQDGMCWMPVESEPCSKHHPGAADGMCCAGHNQHCEPPGDLCCRACPEVVHDAFPVRHPDGSRCVLDPPSTRTVQTPVRNTRLPGHELRHEGRIYGGYGIGYINGPGKTKCTCGTPSPELPSTGARKRWHQDHKNDIRSERGLESMNTRPKGSDQCPDCLGGGCFGCRPDTGPQPGVLTADDLDGSPDQFVSDRPERLCTDHSGAAIGGPKNRCPVCQGDQQLSITAPYTTGADHG